MSVKGIPAFTGLAIMEIEAIDYRAGDPALVAHAAFINERTGRTYGSTTGRIWSEQTMLKLEELRLSMETDMARMVFEEEDMSVKSMGITTGRTSNAHPNRANVPKGGIGEELEDSGERVPSI